jgi:DNA (cytosine-5)-methyltransferase 1
MFKFIDLFCGVGGIRIPFDEIGGHCVFSSDIDKFAQKTYFDNFGHLPHGDITDIDVETIPAHDVLLAGFPCQPFSQAGLKRGFDDARGTLFFYIAKILSHHRPKFFLLENVKRLRTHDGGKTLKTIIEILTELGYTVSTQVLNGRDFGLPQNRERIYIVGIYQGNTLVFPEPDRPETCLGDILEHGRDFAKQTISDALWAGHKRRKVEHAAKGFGFGYQLYDAKSSYTGTLSARYYKDGSEILIAQRKANPRKLTPREAARLQGFPDSFKITVSDNQAYKQFGNSVCVPVIRAIAQTLHPIIKQELKTHTRSNVSPVDYSYLIPASVESTQPKLRQLALV